MSENTQHTPRLKSIFDTDPDFRRESKTDYSCVNCHRPINKGKGNYRLVHVVDGGGMYLHPEDEGIYLSDAGDCGFHPVGMDCAKKIGIEWTHGTDVQDRADAAIAKAKAR